MHPDGAPWAYDAIAGVYDDDMAPNAPSGDVDFYVRECRGAGGPVLELACGTGRITLPLVSAGLEVTAVDRSAPMLEVLEAKRKALPPAECDRLRIVHGDMRDLSLGARFAAVSCPYSAFTYLVTSADRDAALAVVRRHLGTGGVFLLDVFVPDAAVARLPDDHVMLDYRRVRADGTVLERSKTVAKDVEPGVNVVRRTYRVVDAGGRELEHFTTESRIHYFHPEELRAELERAGFAVELLGDFGAAAIPARTAVFRCRLRT